MNGKLVKASLAGAAAIALLTGGTTYAAFTGSAAVAAKVTAATFDVHLDSGGTGSTDFTSGPGGLVPGGPALVRDYRLVNAGDLPAGSVSVQLANRQDSENGCSGSEKDLDPNCDQSVSSEYDRGDLSNQADVTAWAYAPTGSTCTFTEASAKRFAFGVKAPQRSFRLDDNAISVLSDSGARAVQALPGGSAPVCVRLAVSLPDRADNDAVQGDTTAFRVKLALVQATPSTGAAVLTQG